MITNELLEEKYKAQRILQQESDKENKDYFEVIEEEVQELFDRNGWEFKISARKGGFVSCQE